MKFYLICAATALAVLTGFSIDDAKPHEEKTFNYKEQQASNLKINQNFETEKRPTKYAAKEPDVKPINFAALQTELKELKGVFINHIKPKPKILT